MFNFFTIKAVMAALGADWGCQTGAQAAHKNRCWRHRGRHVGIVALVLAICAATSPAGWGRKLAFVLANAIPHFVIDGVRLPKWLDQVLHLAIAVATAPLLRGQVAK